MERGGAGCTGIAFGFNNNKAGATSYRGHPKKNGRGERIRTSDPLVPNQVRYQTALRPELLNTVDAVPERSFRKGKPRVAAQTRRNQLFEFTRDCGGTSLPAGCACGGR